MSASATTGRIPLPAECEVGRHEPGILHRSGGADARVVNRCGKCGREIQRDEDRPVLEVGRGDPWMTEEQHAEWIRELEADERVGESTADERCPPRE